MPSADWLPGPASGLPHAWSSVRRGAAQQGKTTIQVVPYRAGAHAGTTGPFVILDFPEPTDPAVVYVETLAGDIYLEQRSDVNRYILAFDRLVAAALHPDESVQLIDQASSGMT